jgi:hypothetical protein
MAKPRLFDRLDHFSMSRQLSQGMSAAKKSSFWPRNMAITTRLSIVLHGATVPPCGNAAVQNGGANGERLSPVRRQIRDAAPPQRLSCLLHEALLRSGHS